VFLISLVFRTHNISDEKLHRFGIQMVEPYISSECLVLVVVHPSIYLHLQKNFFAVFLLAMELFFSLDMLYDYLAAKIGA
jgi:hypothetical protein